MIEGECARKGKTLDEWCKPDGCALYFTKKGVTPVEFQGLMDAAFVCRARQKAGLDLTRYPMPFWAEKAYLLANGIFSQVENEYDDDDDVVGRPKFTKGDSGVFALINEHLAENGERIKDDG